MRRILAGLVLSGAIYVVDLPEASAHAALRRADPAADVSLDVPPTAVHLSLSEEPEPSLSVIRVADARGVSHQLGAPQAAPDYPRSLVVPLRPLERGVYTVTWRVVSAVDGHATGGVHAFGVGVSPTPDSRAAARISNATPSPLELVARWLLVAGLVVLLGAAGAGVVGFGRVPGGALAAAGWVISALAVLLLAEAQRRAAAASLGALWSTPVGRALAGRGIAVAVAGTALLLCRLVPPRHRRWGMGFVAAAATAGMAVHVAAGHAAGTGEVARVAVQWTHFVAAGVWVGGLAALLFATRGAPSEAKAAAVRRFSGLALPAALLVVVTGVVRAFDESSWDQLWSTGYGRTIVLKAALVPAMLGLGFLNRRGVRRITTALRSFRRRSGAELILAAGALAGAALLGALPPPAGQAAEPLGLVAEGVDFGRSVRARLSTQSAQPGANRFAVRLVDAVSGRSLRAERVALRFMPLDDPEVAPTTLALQRAPDGTYVGSGTNLTWEGRWRVTALVDVADESVSVPIEVTVPGPAQFVSVVRTPGQPVRYTVDAASGLLVRIHAEPARAGSSRLHAAFFDDLGNERIIDHIVLTTSNDGVSTGQHVVRRVSTGRFVTDAVLSAPRTTVAVVARTRDGSRFRAVVDLTVEAVSLKNTRGVARLRPPLIVG